MAMIQWFPGHMHLTQQAIAERVKATDVVLELLDARLPGSSANPLLARLTRGKPALKLLNKQDLADPARTELWLTHYNAQPGTRALALDASMAAPAKALLAACSELAPHRGGLVKPMRVLICGIPNVGKSTLINSLAGRRQAKTGDEAGVTRLEQRIAIAPDCYLYDTPGVLWPRIIVAKSGYNLAASGAVGRNAFDDQEVALELLHTLRTDYPAALLARYKLASLEGLQGQDAPDVQGVQDGQVGPQDEAVLQAIGRQRGALQSGRGVDLSKAAALLIHDFRCGALGRITLETPEQFARWLAAGEQLDAQRQLRKDAIERDRQIRFKRLPRPAPEKSPQTSGPRRRSDAG